MTLTTFWQTWPATTATTITTLVPMAALFAFAAARWPGKTDGCYDTYQTQEDCFCERPRGSQPGDVWFAQPSNAWSNMAFVVVGLFCAWCTDTRTFPFSSRSNWWDHHDNFMTGLQISNNNDNIIDKIDETILHPNIIPISYCCVVAFLGPGSMFKHASLTFWGATIDVLSMVFYTGWTSMYIIGKFWFPRVDAINKALILYLIVMIILVLLVAMPVGNQKDRNELIVLLYNVFILVSIGFESFQRAWFRFKRSSDQNGQRTTRRKAEVWIFVMGLVTYVVASVVWSYSVSGGSRCFPNSWIQGHAVWHILSAVSTGWIFFYALSERSVISPPPSSFENNHNDNAGNEDVV